MTMGMSAGGGAHRHRPSPNFGPRAPDKPIDILLIHYTGMASAEAALDRLCDPAAQVSAHYLIEEDGTIWSLVDEQHRAWHAGIAYWAGETDINSRSIGIELVNPGHELGYRPFPMPQMDALAGLAREIVARHKIPNHRVLGHSDVAPERKCDPGELFGWAWLAAQGVGIWPAESTRSDNVDPAGDLRRIGYKVEGDIPSAAIVTAFQRHFRPSPVDACLDRDTQDIIAAVAGMIPLGDGRNVT